MGTPGVSSKSQHLDAQRPSTTLQGSWAEQRALRLLQQRGWQLVVRNWRCRWGEIDLLVEKPGRLLLVEVKGRRRCGPDGWGWAPCTTGSETGSSRPGAAGWPITPNGRAAQSKLWLPWYRWLLRFNRCAGFL